METFPPTFLFLFFPPVFRGFNLDQIKKTLTMRLRAISSQPRAPHHGASCISQFSKPHAWSDLYACCRWVGSSPKWPSLAEGSKVERTMATKPAEATHGHRWPSTPAQIQRYPPTLHLVNLTELFSALNNLAVWPAGITFIFMAHEWELGFLHRHQIHFQILAPSPVSLSRQSNDCLLGIITGGLGPSAPAASSLPRGQN